jgi:glycosyltransferase involved in cell wall biosynthesis
MLDPGNYTPYYVDGLCRSLSRLGVRPRVITSPPLFEPVDAEGVYDVEWLFFAWLTNGAQRLLRRRTRVRQALKAATYPNGVLRTWRTLRLGPAGVLHVHWALLPVIDVLLLRALRRRGWTIVLTLHDPCPEPEFRVAYRRHQALLAAVDILIVHTAGLGRQLTGSYPDTASKIRVIAHGGDGHPMPRPHERAQARQLLGLENDVPVLLFFGMIKPYKGLDYLLDAMPRVVSAFPRVRLVIAGEPFVPLSRIERRIERLGLGESVRLRASFVPQREVASYFTAADLLVAPHVDVAASGVVVLAQSFGLPVVTTDVGGLPEFVCPDSCGVVVPPRSADALGDAICGLLADGDQLHAVGRRGHRRLARENDWLDVARRTLEVYASVPLVNGDAPAPVRA